MALIKCHECGHDVSDKAPACPNCDAPLKAGGALDEAFGGMNPFKMPKLKGGFGCGSLILTAIVIVILLGVIGGGSSNTPQHDECTDDSSAYMMSQEFVKRRLKAPATAEFPSTSNATISGGPECKFSIDSYVDAQNSFGAKIRNSYHAEVQYDKAGKDWKLLLLNMGGS